MALCALDNEGHSTVKINGKKDLTAERLRAREVLDKIYMPRLRNVMGDPVKFALYQAKAANSRLFSSGFDNVVIEDKHTKQLTKLAEMERNRQADQARIDNATSAAEIETILKGILNG